MPKRRDEFFTTVPLPTSRIVFASTPEAAPGQTALFSGNFRDECFVLSCGIRSMPHPEISGALTGETALWAYRHIVQKRFYSKDKEKLVKRIFRTVNINCFQKRRESGFEEGLAATLLVIITGQRNVWIGNVGDNAAYVIRGGQLSRQTSPDVDARGRLTKLIGLTRYGLVPQFVTDQFLVGDTAVALSADAAKVIAADTLVAMAGGGSDERDVRGIADSIYAEVMKRGASGIPAVCVIRRRPAHLPVSSLLVNPT